jgi:hypothetical protein
MLGNLRNQIPNISSITTGETILVVYMIISLFPILISFPVFKVVLGMNQFDVIIATERADTFFSYTAFLVFLGLSLYISFKMVMISKKLN